MQIITSPYNFKIILFKAFHNRQNSYLCEATYFSPWWQASSNRNLLSVPSNKFCFCQQFFRSIADLMNRLKGSLIEQTKFIAFLQIQIWTSLLTSFRIKIVQPLSGKSKIISTHSIMNPYNEKFF
jgi:hypothetical protein